MNKPFFCTQLRFLFMLHILAIVTVVILAVGSVHAADRITQYGIIWTFDKDYPSGQFCTGDYWVVGPVKIVGITTDLHAPGFAPRPGEDGTMVNPGTDARQGYDNRLTSYDVTLNSGLPNGKPVSKENPLVVTADASVVSMVSWLYKSEMDTEPGTPKFNGGTKAPRPVTRSGAVLTVLKSAPPEGSFRPAYAGTDKSIKFNISHLDKTKLKNLAPVGETPDPAKMLRQIERPWIDHVNEYLGAMIHPSENLPNYGRDLALLMSQATLLLNVDFAQLPDRPSKDKLLIAVVQFGIDCTGIADNGGGWPANGGHALGRKWPILFAGTILNDPHMKSAGTWKTRFQEDEQTFYVSQAEVAMTKSAEWRPDKRGGNPTPYKPEDIGMAEWGITHTKKPQADNAEWKATYRGVNGPVFQAFVLCARIMDQQEAWNHKPLFDYADRWMKISNSGSSGASSETVAPFVLNMWNAVEANKGTSQKLAPAAAKAR